MNFYAASISAELLGVRGFYSHDVIMILAENESDAENQAMTMCNQRFPDGGYKNQDTVVEEFNSFIKFGYKRVFPND